jgi:tetratricopeptide (TPR) repeat protein
MIVKDEEKYIEQCLNSALPLVDEVIIVDTGSTDNTINIIENNYIDKVKLIKHDWNNDFAEARNKSIIDAKGDWILILDADEKISFDKEKLLKQLEEEDVDGYNIPMYNFLSIDNILYSAVMPRLLKNNDLRYIGAIHEQVRLNGEELKKQNTFETTTCKIIHYGYLHENVLVKNKTRRNINIIKNELEKNPKDGFQWYNLGVTYMGEANYGKAIDAFLQSHKYSQNAKKSYHDDLVLSLAKCLYQEKSYKQLNNYLDALSKDQYITKYPEYYYYYGKMFEKKKKYNRAIKNFERAIKVGEVDNSISQKGMGSFIPNIEIARILVKQKKINEAVMKYMESIFHPDNFTHTGIKELVKLLEKHKMNEVFQELRKLLDKNELEKYKIQKQEFKEKIQSLIEQGLIDDAKVMIDEYEKIINNDIDIYSMKGIIAIMEGYIDEAYTIIIEGLRLSPKNVDLLYNKAYILELKKKYKESYRCYKHIINMTKDISMKEEAYRRLKEIESIDSNVKLNGKLGIFIINKKLNDDILDFIINWFPQVGYTILKDINSLEDESKRYIILYDIEPIELKIKENKEYSSIIGERFDLIEILHNNLEKEFDINNSKEFLYLSKNELEAEEIATKILNVNLSDIYKTIRELEMNYATQYHVVKQFNGFRLRAKTELIQYRDGLAVKKTWKPGNEKFYEREKFACGELSKKISYIPQLLENGKNYIIIPYYEDILNDSEDMRKRVLTTHIVDIAYYYKQLYDAGFYNPDMHPGQFVFSIKDGLKAIDFEYLQLYEEKPDSFIEGYDIKGYPKGFKGDKPIYNGKELHKAYNSIWVKYTGYELKQIANLVIKGKYNNNDPEINKVLGLLNYAKTSGQTYDGSLYESAYHSLKLKGYYFRGQRECSIRLQKVPYDFSNKTVLDIGCNAGGMLHAISDKIKMGIGIDYDYRLINAANAIKTINRTNNLSFYRFDLEKEDFNLLNSYILSENGKIDICFLLSVCMWIKNWKEVISYVSLVSNNLIFETNGTGEQQMEQIEELNKAYEHIEVIEEESNDDPGQPDRKLLFCTKKVEKKITIESNIEEYNNLLKEIIRPEYNINYKKNHGAGRICKIYVDNDKNKLIDFQKLMSNFFDLELYRNYTALIENRENIEGIITGLSYFDVGIDEKELKKSFANLAMSSQDLFYDYAMLKHVVDEVGTPNLKQVIIGLSNYSFRYDLSLTQNLQTKEKPKIYYPILRMLHNYANQFKEINEYDSLLKKCDDLFKADYFIKIYKCSKDMFNMSWDHMLKKTFNSTNLSEEEKQREIYMAQRWNHNYPHTIQENIEIFREMLCYLKDKNIKVTIITNPVTDFYKNHFPQNCIEQFEGIIGNFKTEFDFTFINGYNINCFDNDFYDASHLNKQGAQKFTYIINESIEN